MEEVVHLPGPVVEVDEEAVDAAVVGVDGDVPREVLAAGPALALQLGQPPAQHARRGRVVRVVPVAIRVRCSFFGLSLDFGVSPIEFQNLLSTF